MILINKPLVPKYEPVTVITPDFFHCAGSDYGIFDDCIVQVFSSTVIIWSNKDNIFDSKVLEAMKGVRTTQAHFHNAYRAVTSRINNLLSNARPVSEPFNVGEGAESAEELNNN